MSDQHRKEIVHRQLETDRETPVVQIAEIVADLEGETADELSTMYERVDHLIDNIFSRPPSPEAQVEVTFSYEGYRITVDQDGSGKFVKTE